MLCENLDYNTYLYKNLFVFFFSPEYPQGSGDVASSVLLALLQGPHDSHLPHGGRLCLGSVVVLVICGRNKAVLATRVSLLIVYGPARDGAALYS